MIRKEIISRLRNSLREIYADSKYSNRYLWNVFFTVSKKLLKEDADKGKIYSQSNPWESICVKMTPVSSLYCNCAYLPYNCTVYRSEKKLPRIVESSTGFIYRLIATPDLSQEFTLVSPYLYSVKKKIKYNKEKYAFIYDNYLYTPDNTFPVLTVSGLFDDDTSKFKCNDNELETETENCGSALNVNVSLNDYLIDTSIKMALMEILPVIQKPTDEIPNNNNNQKEISI